MTLHTELANLVEQPPENLAVIVGGAFLVWLVYGVLGPAYLGADDDFWPYVRRWLARVLDLAAVRIPGLYVRATSTRGEYVGYHSVQLPVEQDPIDGWELALGTMGYDRNVVASVKKSYWGQPSDGSWARRYGYLKGTGAAIRAIHQNTGPVLSLVTWVPDSVGRILGALGDVLALRQVHVGLYTERVNQHLAHIHVFVHDEPNSLNPLTMVAHYRAHGWNAERGKQKFLDDVRASGQPFTVSDPPEFQG